MVRKLSTKDVGKTEEPKKSRGRPRKISAVEKGSNSGKRKLSKSVSEEPRIKQKKIEVPNLFELASVGVALTLGQGDTGQLGLGEDIMERKKPALVRGELDGKKIKKIIGGGMHTVCLTDDHKVYSFGCNDEGALGRLTSDDSEGFEPKIVGGSLEGVKVIDISAGDSHCAALSEDGNVFLWGCFRDNHGRLGLAKEWEKCGEPIKLDQIQNCVVAIASGCDHVAMITDEGKVFTLGCGEQGQLGRLSKYALSRGGRKSADEVSSSSTTANPEVPMPRSSLRERLSFAEERCLRPKPVTVPKIKGKSGKPMFCEVYCGSYCTYIVSTDGDVFGFGLNNYHQLGIPDGESRYMPVYIPAFSEKKWRSISGGLHHSMLLDEHGDVYCIGRGDYGRLGLGEKVLIADKPTKIEALRNIVQIGAGPCVSFAVDKNGKAFAWGMGTNFQLTSGEEDDEWTPIEFRGKQLEERSVIMVGGGGQHTVLLACDKIVNGE
nr:regulator of chromosome condensation-like isoform X2 [Styela clava]